MRYFLFVDVIVLTNSNFILGIQFTDVGKKYVLSLYWATATATSTG